MNFSPTDIKQGRINQAASQETPESFATIDGAAAQGGASSMNGGSRMAGQMGARALTMINNPAEQQRTKNWMNSFGLSNQGMDWNQAKAIQMNPQPKEEEGIENKAKMVSKKPQPLQEEK